MLFLEIEKRWKYELEKRELIIGCLDKKKIE